MLHSGEQGAMARFVPRKALSPVGFNLMVLPIRPGRRTGPRVQDAHARPVKRQQHLAQG